MLRLRVAAAYAARVDKAAASVSPTTIGNPHIKRRQT
jgi:hypothetical protein